MSQKRRSFSREFKIQLIQEIDSGMKTVAQAAREHNIHASQIYSWQKTYRNNPEKAFSGNGNTYKESARIAELERKVGQLTVENDLLKKLLDHVKE